MVIWTYLFVNSCQPCLGCTEVGYNGDSPFEIGVFYYSKEVYFFSNTINKEFSNFWKWFSICIEMSFRLFLIDFLMFLVTFSVSVLLNCI